jgi:hypothetical protein
MLALKVIFMILQKRQSCETNITSEKLAQILQAGTGASLPVGHD